MIGQDETRPCRSERETMDTAAFSLGCISHRDFRLPIELESTTNSYWSLFGFCMVA